MATLSVCMIVKNEEETIARCLECAQKIADEIIVVDTGSTDNTKEICKKFTDKIYDFKWCYDFSKARNYSFSKATKDYIMWLDADDVILDSDIDKIIELKRELDEKKYDIVKLKYDMSDKNGNITMSYYRERILKKSKGYKWISPIHEVIIQSGFVVSKDISITHKKIKESDPKRNLIIFEKMLENGYIFDARQKFYYARELYYNKKYDKSINEFKEFLSRDDAWIENKITACSDLGYIYITKNEPNNALKYLIKSIEYDFPRPQICCQIAEIYFNKRDYTTAIKWYKTAISQDIPIENGGFYVLDFSTYIPNIMLCVCYDRLGNHELANKYNEIAGSYKKDGLYLSNKTYFENILKNTSI